MTMSSAASAADGGDAPPAATVQDAARLEWLWSEYEQEQARMRAYEAEGMDIYPSAGFVVKTVLLSAPSRPSAQFPALTPAQVGAGKLKFFLNVCSDPSLALPSMEDDGQGGQRLRVPISAGPVLLDVEKDGSTPCLVCDVVLNPDTVVRASSDKDFRLFMCGFALGKIQDKHHCALQLEAGEIKFPKMKFKGALPPKTQHIRRPKGAHIEPEDAHAEQRRRNAAAGGGGGGGGEAATGREDGVISDEEKIERMRAAAAARTEALRQATERESGLTMSKGAAIASSGGANIFTSEQQAAAAAEAAPSVDPFSNSKPAPAAAAASKIEVLSDEPAAAPAAAASSPAAAASASVSASAGAPAAHVASSSSLPDHQIWYLKPSAAAADDAAGTTAAAELLPPPVAVPASEWDIDLSPTLPEAIRVTVTLPLLSAKGGAGELEVSIAAEAVSIASSEEFRDKHAYQLHMAFPFLIDADHSECKWSKKTRVLTLTLPVTGLREVPQVEDEAASASASASVAAAVPAKDWKMLLGLANTVMYDLCAHHDV